MPVDEATRLPSTPLPDDELEGELGGHSLQLVKELNAVGAAHVDLEGEHDQLRIEHDALVGAVGGNEALDASEGQLAEVDTRLAAAITQGDDDSRAAAIHAVDALAVETAVGFVEASAEAAGVAQTVEAALQTRIAQGDDDARAAALSAVDELAVEVSTSLAEVATEAAGYADVAATLMREEVARSADDVTAAALSAVDELAVETGAGFVEASAEAAGVAQTVETALQAKIAQVEDDVRAAATSAIDEFATQTAEDLAESSAEAAGYAQTVETALQTRIAQSADDQGGLLAAEVGVLNERIGKVFPLVQTNDVTTTDLITPITIALLRSTLLEVRVLAQRTDRLERAMYTIEALARVVPSLGTLTVAGVPNVGDQVELDGVTYTFQTVLGAALDVLRDAGTAEANIDNLVDAINRTGTPGVEYHADTPIHPTFSARKDTVATMEAVAKVPGTGADGSSTTDPTDVAVALSWGAVVTAGGSDMTVTKFVDRDDVEDEVAWDADVVAGTGSTVEVKGTAENGKDVDWLTVVRVTEI